MCQNKNGLRAERVLQLSFNSAIFGLSTERRCVPNAGHPVGRRGRPAVRPNVTDGRWRRARVRRSRQPDGQIAQPGNAHADVPLLTRRERPPDGVPTPPELRLVHGRRAARHVRVRPAKRAIRRPVRRPVRGRQTVLLFAPPSAPQRLAPQFQHQTRPDRSHRPNRGPGE